MEDEEVDQGCCFARRNRASKENKGKNGFCFKFCRGENTVVVDFREFCLSELFIPLSAAFILALALDRTVEQFVSSWLTPLIGIAFGEHHDDLVFTIRDSKFTYGTFIDSFLNTRKCSAIIHCFFKDHALT